MKVQGIEIDTDRAAALASSLAFGIKPKPPAPPTKAEQIAALEAAIEAKEAELEKLEDGGTEPEIDAKAEIEKARNAELEKLKGGEK